MINGIKAYEVVGYSYNADIYCTDCTELTEGNDGEGNPVHAIFAGSEDSNSVCGHCHCYLIEQDCEVCGDSIVQPHNHEQVTQLQPSLHTLEDYADTLLSEADALGVDISKIDTDMSDSEAVDWVTDEVIEAISDAGFCVVQDSDYLAIYRDIERN